MEEIRDILKNKLDVELQELQTKNFRQWIIFAQEFFIGIDMKETWQKRHKKEAITETQKHISLRERRVDKLRRKRSTRNWNITTGLGKRE